MGGRSKIVVRKDTFFVFLHHQMLINRIIMNNTITNANGNLQVLSKAAAQRYVGMTDGQILDLIAAGDDSAGMFLVFHRYGSGLQQLSSLYAEPGCCDDLLGELVSETYIHFATRGWARLLPREIGNVGGYLYVLERNLLRQLVRRDYRHLTVNEEADASAGCHGGGIDGYEAADQVERGMARLSATRRFVLGKRLVEGYGSKEVAAMLPEFWRSIGESHAMVPTFAYVDNMVSAARRDLRSAVAL